jgi:hypothetical protein
MKITVEQQERLAKAASLGHPLYDCLILAAVPAADAMGLMQDREIFDAFHQGRTQGGERIREKLMAAAMSGNVSAMKCLALHEAPDDDLPSAQYSDGLTNEQRQARDAARMRDLDARFAFQCKLFEEHFDELNRRD